MNNKCKEENEIETNTTFNKLNGQDEEFNSNEKTNLSGKTSCTSEEYKESFGGTQVPEVEFDDSEIPF